MTSPALDLQTPDLSGADPTLIPFLKPRGVAVVGASGDPTKPGFELARNLVQSGYPGAIHFVNPGGGTLLERPVHTDLADVPDPVDLAVLLIPAPRIPETLKACGERGVRAVVIGSGGFRETGAEGEALEQQCLRIARSYGMRLIGPNCVGLIDTYLPLNTTFLPPPGPSCGDLSFISHSGAICAVVIDWAGEHGLGLSRLVSMGNQIDVSETDLLAPLALDAHTRIVALYLEGIRDGRRFVQEALRISRIKPVIALKVGRFESGRRAVASHTGALAGREAAYDAAFRRAGVIRAATSEELFDWARTLAWCPLPEGANVAVLTNAGGPGVTAADAATAHGLRLATLSPDTRAALRELLPPAASVTNPVDMLATASPEHYAACLRLLLADAQVHSIVVILPPPPMATAGAVARALMPLLYVADKPVVIALMGGRMIREAVEYFRAAHVPDYRFPERAVAALAVLHRRAIFLAGETVPATYPDKIQPEAVENLLRHARPDRNGFLPQHEAVRVVKAYGISALDLELARSPAEAVAFAKQAGFPVALKIASPDLPHKSDAGGVLLDLKHEKAVAQGFETAIKHTRAVHASAEISGVYVQRMAPAGQEVIVGTVQDPQFGALILFGSGGVEVEARHDVDFALAPLSMNEAEELLQQTWAGRRLGGYRNVPRADRPAAIDVVLRLAQLAADFPQFEEIEINPLRVLPDGQGACAVDIRIRFKD